jgi:hypothetical protein
MYDAGIIYVQIGYESSSDTLLKKIHKKNTFASNLLYIKFATQYNVLLGHVNVLVNMPDETTEDIVNAIDNLIFLRFFLHKTNFRHNLIPVQINTMSRYYKAIQNEISAWTLAMPAYAFLKDCMNEKYHWDILSFTKQTRNFQWDVFKKIETYYLDNQHTYSISNDGNIIKYTEYINGRQIFEMNMKTESLEANILFISNNEVVSLDSIIANINNNIHKSGNHSSRDIINAIDRLYQKGLVFCSPDYTEIIAIINIEQP